MSFKKGALVTVIERHSYGNGHVLEVTADRPDAIHGVFLRDPLHCTAEDRRGWKMRCVKKHCLILPGTRWDVVRAWQQAYRDFKEAERVFHQAEERALSDFRDRWREENPFPKIPPPEEVLQLCDLVHVPEASTPAIVAQ